MRITRPSSTSDRRAADDRVSGRRRTNESEVGLDRFGHGRNGPFWSRHFLTLAVLLLVGSTAAADDRPNILLILCDDMGFSDIGCYGGEIDTPHIDRLAAGGIRFTQFYNTSKCFPSRACLLTGVYSQQCRMARRHGPIQNAVTLGEVLRTAGYRTLWAGKHHGTENPFDRGFDRYDGLRDGACNYFNPGLQRPGEPKPAQKRYGKRNWCIDGETLQPYTPEQKDFYTTDYFTNRALAWLDEYKGEDKPFLLYMAYNAPHDPLMAWPQDIAKYRGKYRVGYEAIRNARYNRQVKMGLINPKTTPLSKRESPDWETLSEDVRDQEDLRMAVYAAMVDRMDQNIGRLLAKIRELGEEDNTLVMFCSDNGGSSEVVDIGSGEIGTMTRWSSVRGPWANVSNTPFRKFKNYSHEGGICTPLVVCWPKVVKDGGRICRRPGHFIDFMATLVDIAGADYPSELGDTKITPLQGESLVPIFRGEKLPQRKPIFWQWDKGRAVRQGKWKLVSYNGPWELYDLSTDRTETDNLAAAHPEIVTKLADLWQQWYADCYQ